MVLFFKVLEPHIKQFWCLEEGKHGCPLKHPNLKPSCLWVDILKYLKCDRMGQKGIASAMEIVVRKLWLNLLNNCRNCQARA